MPLSFDVRDPAFVGDVAIPQSPKATAGSQWPRMLNLGEDVRTRLVQYLDSEIGHAISERQPMVDDWIQWQKDYWAKPETKEKNFPFKRAANIVIPLTAIAVEAIYARLMNTLFSVEPFFSVRPKIKDFVEPAPAIEEWYQTEVEGPLNIFGFCSQSLLELIKLGTGVGKSGYERDVKKSIRHRADGTDEVSYVEVHNGATLDYVPVANFLIRVSECDPQTAPWVGEEHVSSWSQMKRMALDGRWMASGIEKVKMHWRDHNDGQTAAGKYNANIEAQQNSQPEWSQEFHWQEIWLSFDVDNDGVDEEIVVDFHRDSLTILSARYNWYDDLHRPYRVGQYIIVEGKIWGIGVGKQSEQFQKIVTTMHRQRLDNATLANIGMLALKKTSGYGPGEQMWPGKLWFFDDPSSDIKEFKLSEVYVGEIQHEEYARQYHDKYVGTNELVLGLPHEGTPGTATGDVTRLAESNKKFDLVLKNIRRWLSQLGMDCLANYQQFGTQNYHWLVAGPEDGQYIERFLQMPTSYIRRGAILDVTVTDSITNTETHRAQWQGTFAILSQYYDKVLERAMMMQDPKLIMAMGGSALQAGDYAIRRLLETFKEARLNIDKLLLYERFMQNAQQMGMTPDETAQQFEASGTEGSAGPGEVPGMGQIAGVIGSGGGG